MVLLLMQDHRHTWIWSLLTLLCFTPISHTVFPTHLGNRGIAEADAGDVSYSTGYWTGRPGRPMTPATILTYYQRKEQNSSKRPTWSSNTNSLVKLAFEWASHRIWWMSHLFPTISLTKPSMPAQVLKNSFLRNFSNQYMTDNDVRHFT